MSESSAVGSSSGDRDDDWKHCKTVRFEAYLGGQAKPLNPNDELRLVVIERGGTQPIDFYIAVASGPRKSDFFGIITGLETPGMPTAFQLGLCIGAQQKFKITVLGESRVRIEAV